MLASRLTVTSPSGETRRAGAFGVIETDVVSGVGVSLVVISAPEANNPPSVAPVAARTMASTTTKVTRRDDGWGGLIICRNSIGPDLSIVNSSTPAARKLPAGR